MKIVLFTLMIAQLLFAGEAIILNLRWDNDKLTLLSENIISGKFKKSRSKGVSGPASNWSWQIVSANGEIIKESRFTDPLESDNGCSTQVDSTEFSITVPQYENGATIRVVQYSDSETQIVGTVKTSNNRTASSQMLGSFTIEGAKK